MNLEGFIPTSTFILAIIGVMTLSLASLSVVLFRGLFKIEQLKNHLPIAHKMILVLSSCILVVSSITFGLISFGIITNPYVVELQELVEDQRGFILSKDASEKILEELKNDTGKHIEIELREVGEENGRLYVVYFKIYNDRLEFYFKNGEEYTLIS